MSYELDKIKDEINQLKWQKVDEWKLTQTLLELHRLVDKVTEIINDLSYLKEKVYNLEQKELERE